MRWMIALAATVLFVAAPRSESAALRIEAPWARPSAPSSGVTAAYFVLVNPGDRPIRVVSAASSLATSVEMHEMSMAGGMMRMRQVTGIDVPARGRIALAPASFHLMVFGLTKALEVGDVLPLTLTLQGGATLTLEARVRASEPSR